MTDISWHQLEVNGGSKEISFEGFNFQIAWQKYIEYGEFEYDYNTPGSEFYLTLSKNCDELDAKAGDVVGWQAKFWVSQRDMASTSLGAGNRSELVKAFETSLRYKNNLKTWIICTPGQPSNTSPHYVKNKLLNELAEVNPNVVIKFWHKPIYEAFYNEHPTRLNHIFKHYFSSKFIGIEFLRHFSASRIETLKNKYDTDLYTAGDVDKNIFALIDVKKSLSECSHLIHDLSNMVKRIKEDAPEKLSAWHVYVKEYIEESDKLLQNLVNLCEELIVNFNANKSLDVYKQLLNIFDAHGSAINMLIHSIDKMGQTSRQGLQRNVQQKNTSTEHAYNNYLRTSTDELLERVKSLFDALIKGMQQVVHVFGSAGFGKTNLACSLCEQLLKKDIPAVLMLGSDFRAGTNLKKQILESLSIDHFMDFTEYLGALDNLGFLKNVKIPIVIDGLNETIPTADIWHHELHYILQDIRKYKQLILLTTCRDSYIQQVFGIERRNPSDVPHSLTLKGFDDRNIDKVIMKYFTKYNITITNENYPKELFQNPLFLRIFSRTNRGKTIEFNQSSIYESIEDYLEDLIIRVSIQRNSVNPVIEKSVRDGIYTFAKMIWDANSRGITYPNEFVKIFDPEYHGEIDWQLTKTYKVQDEGIFISRKMVSGNEHAQFTYDLLGGMCLAKTMIFNTNDGSQCIKNLTQADVLAKLVNTESPDALHPLHDDIIRCIIYLLPKYTGRQVYEVLDDDRFAEYSTAMMGLFFENESGTKSFCQYIDSLDIENSTIQYFIDNTLENVLLRRNYQGMPLLVRTLLRMNSAQIDLKWSEALRKNAGTILSYLKKDFAEEDVKKASNDAEIKNVFLFVSLLLSSTVRYLRDSATKTLVQLGIKYRLVLFQTFLDLTKISDIYVTERLLAALCGVLLRSYDREFSLKVASYLQEEFLTGLETTHILVLDYIDTILQFAAHMHGFQLSDHCFENVKFHGWQEDEKCRKEITGDGRATWGYGPIHLDFAKYVIGSLASRRYSRKEKNTPTLKECLAMIIWRMKELGYSKDVFDEIDKEIAKSRDYYRFDNTMSTERYGKKYSWIAYFEFFGHFVLTKMIRTEISHGYRVSSVDIDPTFPARPFKTQLVSDCFVPAFDESIQEWVTKDTGGYLGNYYCHVFKDEKQPWILLSAYLDQTGRGDTKFLLHVDTVLIDKKEAESVSRLYLKNFSDYRISEHYYLFGGEIPWSRNLPDWNPKIQVGNKDIHIVCPFNYYTWESYHSKCNDIGNVPFLGKTIAQECELQFDASSMSYFTASGELATRLVWDNYSRYLYIRKDILDLFANSNGMTLLWIEKISKYGDFGKHDSTLNPTFKDFQYVTIMNE